MALLTADDFRVDTLAEYCVGLALGEEIEDAHITSAIARLTDRLNTLTNDMWISGTKTYNLNVWGTTNTLLLPARCTALTTVKTRDIYGTETTQSAADYDLVSSLDADGDEEVGSYDAVVIAGTGLTTVSYPWCWPIGARTVEVVGTFGWTTAPDEAKFALAELVWDHFKGKRGDLRRSSRISTQDSTVEFLPTDPGAGIYSDLPHVNDFVTQHRYEPGVWVG